jgi:uncharacterized NAD(P)/FAD-binding protein YdhS
VQQQQQQQQQQHVQPLYPGVVVVGDFVHEALLLRLTNSVRE